MAISGFSVDLYFVGCLDQGATGSLESPLSVHEVGCPPFWQHNPNALLQLVLADTAFSERRLHRL